MQVHNSFANPDADATIEAFRRWEKAILECAESLTEALAPLMRAIGEFATSLDLALREAYQRAGAPYGNTTAGMMRWLQETQEAARLDAQAQAIRQRHEMLADFRAMLDRKNRRNDFERHRPINAFSRPARPAPRQLPLHAQRRPGISPRIRRSRG